MIKYPIPCLLTKNSPMMTPIKVMEMLIFKDDIMVLRDPGMMSKVKFCNFVALRDFMSLSLLSLVPKKPL